MKILISFTFALILGFPFAQAHTRILPSGKIPPRSNSAGLKSGPCGGIAKGNPVATFNMGQTITLQWEETINHPGYFEISISSDNDVTFSILATINDVQNGTGDLPHQNQANITLPAGLVCANCTLRVVQQMTENAVPRPYFSCADIAIASMGADTPTDPVVPPTTPTPPAEDGADCHN